MVSNWHNSVLSDGGFPELAIRSRGTVCFPLPLVFVMESTATSSNTLGPWNKGKLVGQKAPLRLKDIWAIRVRLQLAKRTRELAMFNLAIDSKLRGCDLVKLRVNGVSNGGRVAPRAIVISRKPIGLFNSKSRKAPARWSAPGFKRPPSVVPTICSRVDCRDRLTYRRGGTQGWWRRGCDRSDLILSHTARTQCAGRSLR